MGTITITGMEFLAFHGCYAEEQIKGNKFVVDLEYHYAINPKKRLNDDLSKIVDYKEVYDIVKQEMEIKSKLLETVSQRIVDALFKQLPLITSVKVTVSKLNPPLGGKVEKVGCTMERRGH